MSTGSPQPSPVGSLPDATTGGIDTSHTEKGKDKEVISDLVEEDQRVHPNGNGDGKQATAGDHEDSETDHTASGSENGTSSEGADDDDGDDSDEDEDDSEDDEPALKYQRIIGSIPDLFKKDSASALTVCNKLMVCREPLHYTNQL